jgi:glycine/D-amino acid oxidase-like deaminating enzyme
MYRYDTIVLGLGGMGSAVLYHLAKNNVKALGIEKSGFLHTLGSSHGQSRIIRLAYHEGAIGPQQMVLFSSFINKITARDPSNEIMPPSLGWLMFADSVGE